MKNLKMKLLTTAIAIFGWFSVAIAQDKPAQTLINNVNIFDGENEKLIENANVLIEGNLIKTISTSPIKAKGATVIDGGGRTLMPGLTDAHWHSM
ncbi:MAG: amidohydrolase family protein, partial [Maribacter sp.]